MDQAAQNRIAVFLDAENFVICAQQAGLPVRLRRVVDRLREEGVISFARAYGDWTLPHMGRYMSEFQNNVIELYQLPSRYGKNTADMQMVVDALEMAILPSSPDVFVIVAGDRDFIPLVQRLKRYGKTVMGLGVRGATSGWLDRICNTFLYYDTLVPEIDNGQAEIPASAAAGETAPASRRPRPPPESSAPDPDQESAFRLLLRAVITIQRNGMTPRGSPTRQMMQQLDPTFDLARFRFNSFKDFAEAAAAHTYVNLSQAPGEDLRLEAARELPEAAAGDEPHADEAEAAPRYAFGTPQEALESYRLVLQDKGIPLIPWDQRVELVNHLYAYVAEHGDGALSIAEISNVMLSYARQETMTVPVRAVQKITYSMNLGGVFKVDGESRFVSDIWHVKVKLGCPVEEALERINRTYIEGIRRDHPEFPMVAEGLELLLYDRTGPDLAEKVKDLLRRARR